MSAADSLRSNLTNAVGWLQGIFDKDLPRIEQLAASPVVQELEAAAEAGLGLTPAEEAMVASIIRGLPALRAPASAPATVPASADPQAAPEVAVAPAETPAEPVSA